MTSSEQVREEVAAVLDSVFGVEFSRPYEDVLRDGVDAILARWPVLAGVTDEMVETAARALNRNGWTCDGGSDEPGRYDECEYCRRACAGTVRAVLSAVLGPRDADAPGDGSTT